MEDINKVLNISGQFALKMSQVSGELSGMYNKVNKSNTQSVQFVISVWRNMLSLDNVVRSNH